MEIKNLNAFSAMSRAIDYEITRQALLYNQGQADQIVTETRLWDEGAQVRSLHCNICCSIQQLTLGLLCSENSNNEEKRRAS